MAFDFRIVPHTSRPVQAVEVWRDGVFVASIYPGPEDDGFLHVVSKYMGDAVLSERPNNPVKSFIIELRREPN